MKNIKFLISGAILLLLMFLINEVFHVLLVDDTRSYTRLMMHELYNQEENIDILFLGSSHCYRSLNPKVTDEIFDANTFNGGTSLQGLDGTYAMLVEAGKNNDLKEVYVELYYGVASEIYKKRTDLTSVYLISDYMKHSLNRLRFLLEASNAKHYVNSFILGRREWEKLFDFNYMMELYAKKNTIEYKNYKYITDIGDAYIGKGYVGSEMTMPANASTTESLPIAFYDNFLSEDYKESLKDIISYCEKNNIKLNFFTAPMADSTLAFIGNYDSYINQISDFLAEHNYKYYDFNLCKTDYLNLTKDDYMEPQHLNINGADKFSQLFARYFTGQISDDIFHSSYNEKLSSYGFQIIGYLIEPLDELSEEVTSSDAYFDLENYHYSVIKPIAYTDSEYEFRISKDDGTIIQDWSTNNIIYYLKDQKIRFHIEARNKKTGEIYNDVYYSCK